MIISHANINKSMITKFGIFANYRSLSKTQCSLAFEKLPKLCGIEICLFFIQCFSSTIDNRTFCYGKTVNVLWTQRDTVLEHSWLVPRPFATWPALVPSFTFLYFPTFQPHWTLPLYMPVSHFLLSCYSRWFIICPKMGKNLSLPPFTPTIYFYLSFQAHLKRDTWSISAPAFYK